MSKAKSTQVTGRIAYLGRIESSANGNPRYSITVTVTGLGSWEQTWNTAADHAFNYEVGNPGYRVGAPVTVTIGGRGTITAITPAA